MTRTAPGVFWLEGRVMTELPGRRKWADHPLSRHTGSAVRSLLLGRTHMLSHMLSLSLIHFTKNRIWPFYKQIIFYRTMPCVSWIMQQIMPSVWYRFIFWLGWFLNSQQLLWIWRGLLRLQLSAKLAWQIVSYTYIFYSVKSTVLFCSVCYTLSHVYQGCRLTHPTECTQSKKVNNNWTFENNKDLVLL